MKMENDNETSPLSHSRAGLYVAGLVVLVAGKVFRGILERLLYV
jgi:hypothetical protein